MSALAVASFALSWWLGCYLLARDPRRAVLRRAAVALLSFGTAVACALLSPPVPAAFTGMLLCVAALAWAGTAVALLAEEMPERRQIDRGWLVTSALLLAMVPALPSPGRLVVLAPLLGALVLLWRFRDGVQPSALVPPMTVAGVLYALTLTAVLLPLPLGAPALVLSALGLDLLVLGFVAAVADAEDAAELLRPDLRRSLAGAAAAGVVAATPTAVARLIEPASTALVVLQVLAVALATAAVPLAGPVRRLLDRVAFADNPGLRAEREGLLLAAEALPRRRDRRAVTTEEEFFRLVRRALQHYGDLGRLLRSPLIDLPVLEQRLAARGVRTPSPLVRAAELRAVLREAVGRLKPVGGGFGTTEEWRYYNVLRFGCLAGLKPYRRWATADGLDRDAKRAMDWFRQHVPERSMRRWELAATRIVARDLWAADRSRIAETTRGADQHTRH